MDEDTESQDSGWNFPVMSEEREAYWAERSSAYTLRGLDDDFGEYDAMSFDI